MYQAGDLEERVEQLERRVNALTQRLNALERQPPREAEPASADVELESARIVAGAREELTGIPALAGRSCLAIGGAFLIRSLTESGTLTSTLGVTLGVAYALVWLFLADRAAARGQTMSGAFHALSSAFVVYPLLFEATLRFRLLPPIVAAGLLAAATSIGLFVAWRHALRTVAWIHVTAALAIGVLLLFRTRAVLPFGVYLLLLGSASLALAYGRGWRAQRWVVALTLDVVVLLLGALMVLAKAPPEWLSPEPVLVMQIGLVTIYIGAFVLRLLVQERDVTQFAVLQTVLVLVVGFEGALLVGGDRMRVGIACAALVVGVVLHAVLARRSEERFGHGIAVAYFSSLATFLAAEGARVLLPAGIYPVLWVAAAAMLAAIALPRRRPILLVHAAILAVAAAIASGLFMAAVAALAQQARVEWPAFTAPALVVLLLTSVTAALVYRGATREGAGSVEVVTRTLLLGFALVVLGGLFVRVVGGAIAHAPGPEAAAGSLAVVRSTVLAGAAVLLALWRAHGGRPELGLLAWVDLGLGGLKLLGEDLRVGSAASLVLSLALYGTALILVPALTRNARLAQDPPPAP